MTPVDFFPTPFGLFFFGQRNLQSVRVRRLYIEALKLRWEIRNLAKIGLWIYSLLHRPFVLIYCGDHGRISSSKFCIGHFSLLTFADLKKKIYIFFSCFRTKHRLLQPFISRASVVADTCTNKQVVQNGSIFLFGPWPISNDVWLFPSSNWP